MFRSTLVGKFHQRRFRLNDVFACFRCARWISWRIRFSFQRGNPLIISPPFEVVQRATLPISSFFQALGKLGLDSGVENEFVLLAAISIPYQIAGGHGATTPALLCRGS